MKSRSIVAAMMTGAILCLLMSSCVIPSANYYGGSSPKEMRKAQTRADLLAIAGEPDAYTGDYRFFIYVVSRAREWFYTDFVSTADTFVTSRKNIKLLFDFDTDGMIADTKMRVCDTEEKAPICSGTASEAMWAMLDEYYDAATVDSSRQKEELVAANAARWFQAANDGDVEAMRELLAHGFPNVAIVDDRTALHVAAGQGNVQVIELLLHSGQDVNTTAPGSGFSPLHDASRAGNIEAIRYLVAVGANPDAEDRGKLRPLDHAIRASKTDAVEALLELGADPVWSVLPAARNGDIEIAAMVLDAGGNVETSGWPGEGSPLGAAVRECHTPMVEFLIGRGANVSKGRLVSYAVQHCDYEMVELLLDKGADANKVDLVETDYGADWFTPLALARDLGRDDVAELLISYDGHE